MSHSKHFTLHKPEPTVKISQTDKNNPSFQVVINDLSMLTTFDFKPYKNISGLAFEVKNSSMNITVTNAPDFKQCDSKFRSLLGKLNAENCGLSLRDLDKITVEFNHFLNRNNINSKFIGELRHSNERENPHMGFAY